MALKISKDEGRGAAMEKEHKLLGIFLRDTVKTTINTLGLTVADKLSQAHLPSSK